MPIRTPNVAVNSVAGALLLLSSLAPTVSAQTVPLHVRDCEVTRGGLAVLVIEVCQPRPISQGQICVIVPGIDRVRRARVLSTRNDATATVTLAAPNELLLTFASASGSINETKGALAVIAFRLDPTIGAGYEALVNIDLAGTEILDAAGAPVPTAPTSGRLRVKDPADPFVLYAFSDYGLVGDSAIVEVATRERLRVRHMTIDFEYDTEFFDSVLDVHIFPDAADLVSSVDTSEPGLVRVRLRSDSGRLNDVPGSLFWVELGRDSSAEETDTEIELPTEDCAVRLADGTALPLRTIEYEIR
jgi:hypothetical protein